MKKAVIMLVVLGVLVGLYALNKRTETVKSPQLETPDTATNDKPDPSNATFNFEGEAVTLVDGKNTSSVGPGGALTEETTLTDAIAYGDINDDKRNDTVVLASRSGGGSGLFIYLVAYVSGSTAYRGSNAVFLGDRIVPQTVSINSGIITVNYLDRKEDEPFAAEPTVETSKKFVYRNGNLEERP